MNQSNISSKYIELLKKSLVNLMYIEEEAKQLSILSKVLNNHPIGLESFYHGNIEKEVLNHLHKGKQTGEVILVAKLQPDGSHLFDNEIRNYSEVAHSMIGLARLNNLQFCIEQIIAHQVLGYFVETGIWRGGACIFMNGLLHAHGESGRKIWAADSFEGVPKPTLKEDQNLNLSKENYPFLAVSLDEVKELFTRYDLLDDNVIFLKGWFKDTLSVAPIEKISLLRLDGDLYESTMDALNPLYHKVSSGGYVIVDDYFSCPPCFQATNDFRKNHNIHEEMVSIDNQSAFWRKK